MTEASPCQLLYCPTPDLIGPCCSPNSTVTLGFRNNKPRNVDQLSNENTNLDIWGIILGQESSLPESQLVLFEQ